MNENYIIVHVDHDGEVSVEQVSGVELRKRLNERYYSDVTILDRIPDTEPAYWPGSSLLIIRGDIVTPRPVRTVTEWEL